MLRPAAASALLCLLALAGCAADGGGAADGGVPDEPIAAGNGRLCVVSVDEAIRPVAGANVTVQLADGSTRGAVTGEDGQACLDLPPGTYIVDVSHVHGLYRAAQTTANVEAGREATSKVQLDRLFEQEPYHVTTKFEGFIQCGYDVTVISSLCANDYTRFVTDPQCPQCEHLLGDQRGTDFAVEGGWQAMVYEMTWEPPVQATSERMRLIISHTPRVASHWYCSTSGPDPILLRMEVGVVCEDQQDDPDQVPPEGLPNMHLFAAVDAPPGQYVAVTVSQRFTVFMNFFYYGTPPPDWSFVGGSEFPF